MDSRQPFSRSKLMPLEPKGYNNGTHLNMKSDRIADSYSNGAEMAEKEVIQKVLKETHWNRKEAAKLLHISYKALLYKIEKYLSIEQKGSINRNNDYENQG